MGSNEDYSLELDEEKNASLPFILAVRKYVRDLELNIRYECSFDPDSFLDYSATNEFFNVFFSLFVSLSALFQGCTREFLPQVRQGHSEF